jgi:hypothetical protein
MCRVDRSGSEDLSSGDRRSRSPDQLHAQLAHHGNPELHRTTGPLPPRDPTRPAPPGTQSRSPNQAPQLRRPRPPQNKWGRSRHATHPNPHPPGPLIKVAKPGGPQLGHPGAPTTTEHRQPYETHPNPGPGNRRSRSTDQLHAQLAHHGNPDHHRTTGPLPLRDPPESATPGTAIEIAKPGSPNSVTPPAPTTTELTWPQPPRDPPEPAPPGNPNQGRQTRRPSTPSSRQPRIPQNIGQPYETHPNPGSPGNAIKIARPAPRPHPSPQRGEHHRTTGLAAAEPTRTPDSRPWNAAIRIAWPARCGAPPRPR